MQIVRGPHVVDAEQAVVAALLISEPEEGGRIALSRARETGIEARHFGDERHKLLYRAAERLLDAGKTCDPITLRAFLVEHSVEERAGGMDYLRDLLFAIPTAANVKYHAEIVVRSHEEPHEVQATGERDAQIGEAERFLGLGASDFVRWPWPALDSVLGGMAPGKVHWMAAMSGAGKTSLAMSAAKHWMGKGLKVYVAGLELAPYELRTQLACRVIGVDHGELFKGNLQNHPNWQAIRETLKQEIRSQARSKFYANVRLAPFDMLTADVTATLCERAAAWRADILIIDHADHLDAGARGGHERAESLAIVKTLNSVAKALGLRVFATSQVNREGRANNRLRDHYPLSSEMVRHGDHKLMSSTTFFGARRPLRHDVTREEKAAAQADFAKVREILAPDTMAVNILKDRNGNALGEDIRLGFWRGEVFASPAEASSARQLTLHVARGA
jgi:replicative DNA helicase